MVDLALAATGALALVLATSARWIDRAPLSGPALALVAGVLLGPQVADVLHVPAVERSSLLHEASRLTLAVSLIAVALRFPVRTLHRRRRQLALLLGVVMPAMAVATAGVAAATLGLGVGLAAVLGACLAPTDPVLASSVISGEDAERAVPDRLRQDLTLESGANDGLALPMVVLTVPLVTGLGGDAAVVEALWGVLGALVLGWALGWGAGRLLEAAEQRGTVDLTHAATFSLVLALTGLGLGGLARTDGLLLVFVAGLAFNAAVSREDRRTEELVDESVHRLLILPLFVLFGLTLPWADWLRLGVGGLVFVAGSLLVRRLPWVLLLRGPLGYRPAEAVWLGWFGPIGAAALYYLTAVAADGVTAPIVWSAGSLLVAASTLVHGATSAAGVGALGRALERT